MEVDYPLYEHLFRNKKKLHITIGVSSVIGARPTMEDEHIYLQSLDFLVTVDSKKSSENETASFQTKASSNYASVTPTSSPSNAKLKSMINKSNPSSKISPPKQRNSPSSKPVVSKSPGKVITKHTQINLTNLYHQQNALMNEPSSSSESPNQLFRPHALFAVFDGHSGREAATFCKNNLPKYICSNKNYISNVDRALKESFFECDRELQQFLENEKKSSTAGCTGIVCIMRDQDLIVANVGDSRAVLAHSGKAYQLSEDHKPMRADEKKRIESYGGKVLWGRVQGFLAVSRAFGDFEYKKNGKLIVTAEPEIKHVRVKKNTDFLIMACDGLWDVISSKEAVKYAYPLLLQYKDPQIVCEKLVERALSRKSMDNITCMLVLFHDLNK